MPNIPRGAVENLGPIVIAVIVSVALYYALVGRGLMVAAVAVSGLGIVLAYRMRRKQARVRVQTKGARR
ncbi:hypothetical protein [Streptomyces lydicus]|uniref:hypothetical protein n=1 Tax=Streptomyces lydicus TaxID=47763 RepID=UPI00378E93C4